MTCSRPPVASARAMSRLVITSSAAAGMPGRPSTSDTSPSCITPPLGQLADLGMVEHRLVEHQAVLEGPAHQLGVVDRGAVVAEGHRPGLDQLADLGQFLPLAVLAHAGDDEDVAVAGLGGLVADELDRALAVDGRVGVGHAGDRGEAAGQRRGRARLDRLVLLEARLAEVDVHVDQARGDDPARGVEHFRPAVGARRRRRRSGRRRSSRFVTRSMSWLGSITRPFGDDGHRHALLSTRMSRK